MNSRAASLLAWSLAGLSVAMFFAGSSLYAFESATRAAGGGGASGFASGPLIFLPFLAFPVVGALISSRRPDNPVGWICLVAGFLWMFIVLADTIGDRFIPHPVAVYALTQWIWVPPLGLLGVYLPLLFPDGRFLYGRWRLLAYFSAAVMVSFSALTVLAPGPLEEYPGVRNPFGIESAPWLLNIAVATVALFALCILASALSLVVRYRRSGSVEREQIKWIAFAASFVGLCYSGNISVSLILGTLSSESPEPSWLNFWNTAVLVSYAGIPVALGFAILKHRLYDIDVIINRALVYGSLTATLVATYFGGVATTEAIFRALTGQEEQPQLAVVASTLVIAALFNPLRRRIQGFIDRRFYREKYDAARTLETFSARLRVETDLDGLSDELVGVVRDTMRPEHVSLWLREPTPYERGERDV